MSVNVIIAGVGGQGSILASRIIADAVIGSGREDRVRVGETFGAAMRGGAVSSHVRIGDVVSPLVEKGRCDLVVGLEPLETLRVACQYLAPGGVVVLNCVKTVPTDVKAGMAKYPDVERITEVLRGIGGRVVALNGENIAREAGNAKSMNVVLLGAAYATGALPVSEEAMTQAISGRVPPKTIPTNLRAFQLGREAAHAGQS